MFDWEFTAKVKQSSPGAYRHKLEIEFFAIGKEADGNNYILLDRQSGSFVPADMPDRNFRLTGKKVLLYDYSHLYDSLRGGKYSTYLITVTDQRGVIIAHKTPKKWLFDNLENLRKIPVGRYFNKSCERVFPTRPKISD